MRRLKWKLGIALLTFFIGTVFALVWLASENKSIKSSEVSLPQKPEIKTLAPIIPSNNIQTNNKASRPVRFVKDGGEFCEKYLIKKIAKEKAEDSRTFKLKAFDIEDESLSPKLKDWLQTSIHTEMLVPYELRRKEKKVLLLRANVAGATGIASNFKNWFIQFDDLSINFRSLSGDPKLIFLGKDGLLNYYSVDYGDKFLEKRDWNNVTMDLFRYRINSNGQSELLREEKNVKCE
ncbi:hypothetical protein BH10ACI1_BH10ACI1_29320 [soil metagenome]